MPWVTIGGGLVFIENPAAAIQHVKDEREDVQPGEVHSREWGAVTRESQLKGAELRKELAKVNYAENPDAAAVFFTNGLGLEQVFLKWVKQDLSTPNRVKPSWQVPSPESTGG